MASFNLYNGYSQLHHPTKPQRRNPIIITISITFTFLLASLIGSLFYRSEPQTGSPFSSSDPILLVCNVTRYPDSCFTSISSFQTRFEPDPDSIFFLSLRAAVEELSAVASLSKTLRHRLEGDRTMSTLKDCEELLNDAVERVNQSAAVGFGVVEGSTVGDVKTWISAAMTDVDTCVDGVVEVTGSTVVVDEFKGAVHRATVRLSNSLAILTNLGMLRERFHGAGHA